MPSVIFGVGIMLSLAWSVLPSDKIISRRSILIAEGKESTAADHDDGRPRSRPSSAVTAMQKTRFASSGPRHGTYFPV